MGDGGWREGIQGGVKKMAESNIRVESRSEEDRQHLSKRRLQQTADTNSHLHNVGP